MAGTYEGRTRGFCITHVLLGFVESVLSMANVENLKALLSPHRSLLKGYWSLVLGASWCALGRVGEGGSWLHHELYNLNCKPENLCPSWLQRRDGYAWQCLQSFFLNLPRRKLYPPWERPTTAAASKRRRRQRRRRRRTGRGAAATATTTLRALGAATSSSLLPIEDQEDNPEPSPDPDAGGPCTANLLQQQQWRRPSFWVTKQFYKYGGQQILNEPKIQEALAKLRSLRCSFPKRLGRQVRILMRCGTSLGCSPGDREGSCVQRSNPRTGC